MCDRQHKYFIHPEELIHMLDAIRNATHANMNDTELAAALVDRLPHDDQGAMFWA